jgi:hypothetical protein
MGIKITKLTRREDVFDITVEGTHNFFANNILVHNCAEVDLPTKPLSDINDPDSEISLCTLSAINWGLINDPSEFEKYCDLAVRALDELLDYQKYPVLAAENSTMNRRPLGVGIINLAYFLAKRGLKYDSEALATIDEYAEAWSYYLIKTSANLAAEKGKIPLNHETKYGHGILPIDTYKKDVDDLTQRIERMDWEGLRNQLKETGIRNSTLMALMPAECQSLYNKILTEDGGVMLGEFITLNSNIDINKVHETGIPGQRFEFRKPVKLGDGSTAYECYYNGYQELTEIEFEDGNVYKFTGNHQLKVIREGKEIWVTVDNLLETDDVIVI